MKASFACVVSFFLVLLVLSDVHADRLIRLVDGSIVLLGVGNLDAKKATVLFRGCKDKEGKVYSLKEYSFQSGKDCGPPVFPALGSLDIDGTILSTKTTGCPAGQTCFQYLVESPQQVEKLFSGAKKGDKIEVFLFKIGKTTESQHTKDIDFVLQLTEKTGKVRDVLTFKNVLASDDFVKKVAMKK